MGPEFTDSAILEFVRNHPDPCVTAGEVADHWDVTSQAANYRLKKLEADDDSLLESKRIGASAVAYFVR